MSKTTCHPPVSLFILLVLGTTSGSEPGGAPGPAAPTVTVVWYGGPCGPSAWPATMSWSLLGTWESCRAGPNPWREDAPVGEVGIHHTFPLIPTHPAPQQAPGSCPCAQWIQNTPHGGARWGERGCWQVQGPHGSLSPVLALPLQCCR